MIGSRTRPRARAALLLALTLAPLSACDPPPDVRVEPSTLRVGPRDLDVRVDLVNDGASPVPVSQLRIEGEDWTAFAIQNETNPDAVDAHARAPLTVRVTRRAFAHGEHGHGYASYRPGHAELAVRMGGAQLRSPIEFTPEPAVGDGFAASVLAAGLLALILLGAGWLARALGRRVLGPLPEAPPERPLARSQAIGLALGAGLLAAAWAVLPVGDAVCLDRLGQHVSALELAQCRRGLGGGPLAIAAIDGGFAVWWTAIAAWLALALASPRADASGQARRLRRGFGPLAVLALALAGPCIVVGSLDAGAIVRAQLSDDGAAAIWGVGAMSQPVAFALALLALAQLPVPTSTTRRWPTGLLGPHGLGAAALVTTFLGGWSVPGSPPTSHLLALLAGGAAFAVKLGLVSFAATALAVRAGRSHPGAHTVAPAFGWPLLLALALANLAATILFFAP